MEGVVAMVKSSFFFSFFLLSLFFSFFCLLLSFFGQAGEKELEKRQLAPGLLTQLFFLFFYRLDWMRINKVGNKQYVSLIKGGETSSCRVQGRGRDWKERKAKKK